MTTTTHLHHDTDVVPFLGNREPMWLDLGNANAWTRPVPAPAFVQRPAHRSELPAVGAHRASVAPVTVRSLLSRVRATLSACFRPAPLI